jgi:hypothetical protein
MQNQLFLLTDGVEKGPFTPAEIIEMVREGKLQPDDFLRRENDTRWVPAGGVEPLADMFEDFSAARRRVEALFEVGGGEAPAVTCPLCHAAADGDAAFCTVCGASLGVVEPAPDEKTCPQCGRTLAPDAYFCTGCGRRLDASEETASEIPAGPADEPAKRPPHENDFERISAEKSTGFAGRRKIFAFGGGAAVVVAAALVGVVVADRSDNGYIDGSLFGYESGAGENAVAPGKEIRAPGGEEVAGEPMMSFEVISACGGGRAPREVMDGLTANKERIAEAFAGSDKGAAVVRIAVARSGAVVGAEAERSSSGDPALTNKVASALRTCRLEPAEGTTVAVVRFEYGE